MNTKTFHRLRVGITLFVLAVVVIAVVRNTYALAVAGALAGLTFIALARSKARVIVDEREKIVREKAARMIYTIFTPTIGLSAIILLLLDRNRLFYLEFIGIVLAYLTLFIIVLYAISYAFFDRKYGGEGDEE